MKRRNQIIYEIVGSDFLKIVIAVLATFTFLLTINIYHSFNGEPPEWFHQTISPWLAITDNFSHNIYRPWKIFTYLFTELSLLKLISSCIWLMFFGFVINNVKGKNSLLSLFILNGLCIGVIAYCISYFAPSWFQGMPYFGISEIVLSIAIAAVVYNPTYKVFQFLNGGFSIWIVGLVYALLHLTGMASKAHIVISLCSLAIGGIYYFMGDTIYYRFQQFLNAGVLSIFSNNSFSQREKNKLPNTALYSKTEITQKKLDEILDKINKKGINSLTAQEKEWLETSSKTL